MPKALEGIRILEWAQWVNGSTYLLGDLGAEVIHIEDRLRGDACRGVSAMWGDSMLLPGGRNAVFDGTNRSKKSLTLDVTKDKGREVLYKLVESSQVFVTNYRPSVTKRLKLDYASLSKHNPKLVYIAASGYGSLGQLSEQRAFDPIVVGRSGIMWYAGDRDFQEPVMITGAITDTLGSTMACYAALVGLLVVERLGVGQEIQVSQLGSTLINLLGAQMNIGLWLGRPMARHSRSRARNPMSNHYLCGDNKWLMLAEPQSDRFWHDFCVALGLPELENDPRFANALARRESYKELNAIIDKTFASKPRDEWLKIFREKNCQFAYGPIFDFNDVVADPQALENGYIVDVDHPTLGRTKMVGSPIRLSQTPASFEVPPPEFGQNTEEILMDAGYSWDDLEKLRSEEVI